jgi:hypothetical protein
MAKIRIDAKGEYNSPEALKHLVEQINRYILEIATDERPNTWCSSTLLDINNKNVGRIEVDLTTPVSKADRDRIDWMTQI